MQIRVLLVLLLPFYMAAHAQESAMEELLENIERSKKTRACRLADVVSCFEAAGATCVRDDGSADSATCYFTDQPVYHLQKNSSEEWTIKILWQKPKVSF